MSRSAFLLRLARILVRPTVGKQQQWSNAQTPTTLAIRPILASKHFEICRQSLRLILSADVRRDCVQRFESQTHNLQTLMLNSSTFLWPIWLFRLANMVFSCGRRGCGQYGLWLICLWLIWSVADMVQTPGKRSQF